MRWRSAFPALGESANRRRRRYFYANERATLGWPSSTITATPLRRSSSLGRPRSRSSTITATRRSGEAHGSVVRCGRLFYGDERATLAEQGSSSVAAARRSGSIPITCPVRPSRELRLGDRVAPARNRLRARDPARRGALAGDADDEGSPARPLIRSSRPERPRPPARAVSAWKLTVSRMAGAERTLMRFFLLVQAALR